MKYIEQKKLDEIIQVVNDTLTPEIKLTLNDLHSTFDIWFIDDKTSNIYLLNGFIHNEIMNLKNGENYLYNQLTEDSIGQSKFRLTYIKNHYEKEYIFLNSFNGFDSFNSVLNLYLNPYFKNFGVIDLLQCSDIKEFFYKKYSIENVDSGQLKKSKEIKNHLDFLIDNLGVQGTETIFRKYIHSPELSTIHNILH